MNFIQAHGTLSFRDYMSQALYHRDWGYYAQSPERVGKNGDFFTSVSVGSLFGRLIALHVLDWWLEASQPTRWRLIEIGPNNGDLACDVIAALAQLHPAAHAALEYVGIDPLPVPRQAQVDKLAARGLQGQCLASIDSLHHDPLPSLVLANEVLDALPFQWIERRETDWIEWGVRCSENCADLERCEMGAIEPAAHLPHVDWSALPQGYNTEIRSDFGAFLQPLLASMSHGKLLFFDYGFAAPEYYHPQRRDGTLRVFRQHQAAEDPLMAPGCHDITAHVDFSAVALAAMAHGCTLQRFEPQGFFLSRLAARAFSLHPATRNEQAQFHTLTHPGQLGKAFQVLEIAHSAAATPNTLALQRLAIGI